MEDKLFSKHIPCKSLSHLLSDKESLWKKSSLLNDDHEIINSDAREGPNEEADAQFQKNIYNFQIVPEEKWSFQHGQSTKYSKLENLKRCLEKKKLVYSGCAGDLLSSGLHQHVFYKTKCYNSNKCLSQPTLSSLTETHYHLRTSSSFKFLKKTYLSENETDSLVSLAANGYGLKKEVALQEVSHFEDQDGNTYDTIMRDKLGIEERSMPELYASIISNKVDYSLAQNIKTDSIQEVPEAHCYSGEWNEKWKNKQRFIQEQQYIYNGSAGDLISPAHRLNAYFPKHIKNKIVGSLSQSKASANENYIHELNASNVCISERILPPKTATTNNNKVKIAVDHRIPQINQNYDECPARNDAAGSKELAMQHIITGLVQNKVTDSKIQSEMCNIVSKVVQDKNSLFGSVCSADESSSAKNWQRENIRKTVKEQHCSYSGFAGELISCTSGMYIQSPQMRQAILKRSLSQPAEYVGKKLAHETMLGKNCRFKVFRELPASLQCLTNNTITEDEQIGFFNKNITQEIKDSASLKVLPQVKKCIENSVVILKDTDKELTETIICRDVQTNNTVQSHDVLNISGKQPLIDIMLQDRIDGTQDQTVPNEVNTADCEIDDEHPYIAHNTDSLLDVSNNSESKRLSPDIFVERDDISLYEDSPENVPAANAFLNTNIKETKQNILNIEENSLEKNENFHEFLNTIRDVNDTSICKLSQNVSEQFQAEVEKHPSINNDAINGFTNRVEKKADLISLEDESLTEDGDCLYASDMFPICLTQPAIPTYLLRNNRSELSDYSSHVSKTDTKTLESHSEQCYQETTESTIESTNYNFSTEKTNTNEVSCKSTKSKVISCTSTWANTSLHCQNSVVLTGDSHNCEVSQQKAHFSVSPNSNSMFENVNIQISPQNKKMLINDQLHKNRICETESKDVNTEDKPPYNKNVHTNSDQNRETQLHFSPALENGHKTELHNLKDCKSVALNDKSQQPKGIKNQLVCKGNALFNVKPFIQVGSFITSVAQQNKLILEQQTHAENTDTGYLNKRPSNDTQSNQITPVDNCTTTAEKLCSNNPILTQSIVMDESECYLETSINNHPNLSQHSPSNGKYVDIAENLCKEYSLSSLKLPKSEAIIKELKEEDHKGTDGYANSSSEEYDSDVSISEITSESNIDSHIDDAIEKYQNASPGSEKTLIPESQNMVNSLDAFVQTDIFGLVHVKQCICKQFYFHCEFCNENKEKKRYMISDSEMPESKKVKYCNEKIQMNLSDDFETKNKMQVAESIKYTEDIKTIHQLSCLNKSITSTQPVMHGCEYRDEHNKMHHDVQGVYQHSQLFSWCNVDKSKSLQRSQERKEQNQQNLKPRAFLRIGLSKRAKTKHLHYSCN